MLPMVADLASAAMAKRSWLAGTSRAGFFFCGSDPREPEEMRSLVQVVAKGDGRHHECRGADAGQCVGPPGRRGLVTAESHQ